MGSILKPLVAVELQLCGDLLLFSVYGLADCIQYQIHCLLRRSLVSHNAVVIQISDHRQIQYTLFGLDIGGVGHPFVVRCFGVEVPIEKILVFLLLLSHLLPTSAATDFRQ